VDASDVETVHLMANKLMMQSRSGSLVPAKTLPVAGSSMMTLTQQFNAAGIYLLITSLLADAVEWGQL